MILSNSSSQDIFDKHFALKCPHCNNAVSISAISVPNYNVLVRFRPKKVGIAYKCNGCDEPIFLKFEIIKWELSIQRISISDSYEIIESSMEDFEYEYLEGAVKNDLKEALLCYSLKAYNAFAAMCRRTIQSSATQLGTKGKDKVQKQLEDLKEMADIDDETFDVLKQIIIDGHDGAHPHLPTLSKARAEILLELIKDVVYQLFVRKAKLAKAAELRSKQISESK
ncbi:DUF4145 domain-containing protein [Flavobacterium sp. GN10]|uniref:DUF4145 domain-containing protein n=1 Tax=Flavobacterium tagetis TaxID=2801336 RepID=A0ABS1KHL1_9FLAO|nr:DUF4145 domain-containing protein [Flavobacterium tagetis]MBL0737676.1 DUF4145 domain-containing protein [Flavobacterium tagetis]